MTSPGRSAFKDQSLVSSSTLAVTSHIAPWRAAPGRAARPIFAIGDVHGRLDLLTALHDRIRGIVAAENLPDPLVVHLGDYIDRGPHPLECLARALRGVDGIESRALAGNHEQFMFRFLAAAEAAQDAVSQGRAAPERSSHAMSSAMSPAGSDAGSPVTSFGGILAEDFAEDLAYVAEAWFAYNCGTAVARELGFADPEAALDDLPMFHERLIRRLGPETLARFRAMPNHFRLGDYFFIHGGLHPALDLADQLAPHWGSYRFDARDSDPLWVRGPFLTHPGSFEFQSSDDYADYTGPFIVVHGHTISETPDVLHNRIGVDTGAFMTGRLTAVELRDDKLRFITATGPSVEWGVY
jgi:serine/threonine protein phosphatase 1